MLTPQETENLYHLLTSKDITNITLGLEMAKAHGWNIDRVAEIVEQIFKTEYEEEYEILHDMLEDFKPPKEYNFTEEKSIKRILVGEKLFPLEIILLGFPNLITFLPWQSDVNASFRIHYVWIEDYDDENLKKHSFQNQKHKNELDNLTLLYKTITNKTQDEHLSKLWQEYIELFSREKYYTLLYYFVEFLDNSSKQERELFRGQLSDGNKTLHLGIWANKADAWFWSSNGILQAMAELTDDEILGLDFYPLQPFIIAYEGLVETTDLIEAGKYFIEEFKLIQDKPVTNLMDLKLNYGEYFEQIDFFEENAGFNFISGASYNYESHKESLAEDRQYIAYLPDYKGWISNMAVVALFGKILHS